MPSKNNDKNALSKEYRNNKKINKSNIRNNRKLKEYMTYNDDGIFDAPPPEPISYPKYNEHKNTQKQTDIEKSRLTIDGNDNQNNEQEESDYEEFSADYFEPQEYKK